jgi:cell division septum initiation protein DivIVA
VTAPALAEYERVQAHAGAEYERVKAPALAEYERVQAHAGAEYERVKADTIRTLIPYPFK